LNLDDDAGWIQLDAYMVRATMPTVNRDDDRASADPVLSAEFCVISCQ
jgi:hypothetical protein